MPGEGQGNSCGGRGSGLPPLPHSIPCVEQWGPAFWPPALTQKALASWYLGHMLPSISPGLAWYVGPRGGDGGWDLGDRSSSLPAWNTVVVGYGLCSLGRDVTSGS